MNQSINTTAIEEWIEENLSVKSVEDRLISQGYESSLVKEYIVEFKRLKRVHTNFFGLMFLSFSALVGICAFVIAFHK